VPSIPVIFRQLRPDSGVGFETARKLLDMNCLKHF
jgi:hypothetical protein